MSFCVNKSSSTFLSLFLNLLRLISSVKRWFGKLFQSLTILTKKEYSKELTLANLVSCDPSLEINAVDDCYVIRVAVEFGSDFQSPKEKLLQKSEYFFLTIVYDSFYLFTTVVKKQS